MQLSLNSLISVLSCSALATSAIIPQVPLDYAKAEEAKYGYTGPGVYRLISLATSYAVSLNGSEPGAALVMVPPTTHDDAQRWVIADVAPGVVMFINNGTGTFLSSVKGHLQTRSVFTPPYDLQARWKLGFIRYKEIPGVPAMIHNLGNDKRVLDLEGNSNEKGARAITYPINEPKTKNQGWFLEFLGTN